MSVYESQAYGAIFKNINYDHEIRKVGLKLNMMHVNNLEKLNKMKVSDFKLALSIYLSMKMKTIDKTEVR